MSKTMSQEHARCIAQQLLAGIGIGATVNEWLIHLGVGSSPKHKLAS
jgi:hypothetical protein